MVRQDILDKVQAYDKKKRTNLANILVGKVNGFNDPYARGIVHGLCLALVQVGAIDNCDAVDIMQDLHRDE